MGRIKFLSILRFSFTQLHFILKTYSVELLLLQLAEMMNNSEIRVEKSALYVSDPFRCEECGKGFPNEMKLERHSWLHSRMCDICKQNFKTFFMFRDHVLMSEGFIKCCVCGKQFATYWWWKHHTSSHTRKWSHECQSCNLRFLTEDHYKQHLTKHMVQYPNTCPFCWKTFAYSESFKIHMTIIHNFTEKQLLRKDFTISNFKERKLSAMIPLQNFDICGLSICSNTRVSSESTKCRSENFPHAADMLNGSAVLPAVSEVSRESTNPQSTSGISNPFRILSQCSGMSDESTTFTNGLRESNGLTNIPSTSGELKRSVFISSTSGKARECATVLHMSGAPRHLARLSQSSGISNESTTFTRTSGDSSGATTIPSTSGVSKGQVTVSTPSGKRAVIILRNSGAARESLTVPNTLGASIKSTVVPNASGVSSRLANCSSTSKTFTKSAARSRRSEVSRLSLHSKISETLDCSAHLLQRPEIQRVSSAFSNASKVLGESEFLICCSEDLQAFLERTMPQAKLD